jgi:hypothetical protein
MSNAVIQKRLSSLPRIDNPGGTMIYLFDKILKLELSSNLGKRFTGRRIGLSIGGLMVFLHYVNDGKPNQSVVLA